jgi:hypothetical protein
MNRAALAVVGFAGAANLFGMLPTSRVLPVRGVDENSWTPVTLTTFDSCLGEFITVVGQAHTVTRTRDEGERQRIKGHTTLHLVGVGLTTGVGVQLHQLTNSDFEIELASGVGEVDQVFHLMVVSAGSAANSQTMLNGTMHLDGQGGTQFIAKRSESVCR